MDKSLEAEKKYLSSVTDKIDSLEEELGVTTKSIKEEIAEIRERMWDDQKHGEPTTEELFDLTQLTMTEQTEVSRFYDFKKRLVMLEKMRSSPYFARLDFIEDGEDDEESIYIGYISLIDGSDVLVCDWRADISSMYYDSPLGKTSYTTQYGEINVDLTLRRQFKIRNAQLKYMFDSDIAIEDDVLQEELGKTADLKLKTIITTIQKEQNAIIRDLSGELLLVQGVAGSGKTSIALHRLAYLLYKHRNSLKSDNIVIFSPNGVFSSYIADVLPELGEDRVVQTDFYDFFDNLLNPPKKEEPKQEKNDEDNPDNIGNDIGASISYMVDKIPTVDDDFYRNITEQNEAMRRDRTRFDSVKIKGSVEFSDFLEKYYIEYVGKASFHDVKFLDIIAVTEEELQKLFFVDYSEFSVETRKNKILGKIIDHLENDGGIKDGKLSEFVKKFKAQAADSAQRYTDDEINEEKLRWWGRAIEKVTNEINQMFPSDVLEIYLNALQKYAPEEYEKTTALYMKGHLNFEDMLCVVFLSIIAGKIPPQYKINQIVVDEAQDYPPIIYKILYRLCKNTKFTILGDVNQALTPHLDSIHDIAEYIPVKSIREFNLKKSYRSTVEINNFINSLRTQKIDAEYLDRHGKEPEIIKSDNTVEAVKNAVEKLQNEGFRSNAVICTNDDEAKKIAAELKKLGVTVEYIKPDSLINPGKTCVIPIYLTKGLEFDGVIIPDKNAYKNDANEKQILYVACSRALHRLILIEKQ